MAIINDLTGLFNDVNYVDPNALPPDNGLDPNTGWARGVIEDYNSPSGYSYNGVPVNTDGSRYEDRQAQHTADYAAGNIQPTANPDLGYGPGVQLINDPTGRSYLQDEWGNLSYDNGATWSNESNFNANGPGSGSPPAGGGGGYPLTPSTPQPFSSMAPQDPFSNEAPFVNPQQNPGEFGTDAYQPPHFEGGALRVGDPTDPNWINNQGQLWDSNTQNWADTTQPTAIGNFFNAAQKAPNISDMSQAATTPMNVAGSIFDRAGYETAPTPRDLMNQEPPSPPTMADFKRAEDIMNRQDPTRVPRYGPGGIFMGYGTKNEGSQLGRFLNTAGEVMDAPRKYGVAPFVGNFADMVDSPEGALKTALNPAGLPGIAMETIGRTLNPQDEFANYKSGMARNEAFLNNPDVPWYVRAAARGAEDPMTYAGAMGLNKVGKDVGGLLGGLIEQGSPASIMASNVGAGAAGEYGNKIPLFNKQPEVLQQLEGGILGFAIPGAGKVFVKGAGKLGEGMIKLDAQINEPVGGRLVTAPQEFKVGMSPDGELRPFQFHLPQTANAANDITWLHSTTNPDFKVPDTEYGIYGITQGPGVYMASSPNYGVNYGERAFAVEFDGHAMDLSHPADPVEWNGIKDLVKQKMDTVDWQGPRDRATVQAILDDAFSEGKLNNGLSSTNNYAYRDALVNTVTALVNRLDRGADLNFEPALGQFKKMAEEAKYYGFDPHGTISKGIVQSAIGESGIDGLIHRGRADGDVLIVINGDKARVTAELDKGHYHINDGDTVKDVFETIKGARDVAPHSVVEASPDVLMVANRQYPDVANAYIIQDGKGSGVGYILQHQLDDGKTVFTVTDDRLNKVHNGQFPTITEAIKLGQDRLVPSLPQAGFKSMLNGDLGSSTLGFAARTGLGAAAGAGIAEATGNDWQKGAAIGAGVAGVAPLIMKAINKAYDEGILKNAGESNDSGPITRGMSAEDPNFLPGKGKEFDPMRELMDLMNENRKDMGGRTFSSVDDMTEHLTEPMKKLPPIYPKDTGIAPEFGTKPFGGLFDEPMTPTEDIAKRLEQSRNPKAQDLQLEVQRATKGPIKERITNNILGLLGIPLETLVGGDISAGGRQARGLAYSHPVLWAKSIIKGIEAMSPEKNAALINTIKADPATRMLTEVGNLHMAFLTGEEQLGTGLLGRTLESGASKIKSAVPGKVGSFLAAPAEYLPASERNYNMTLDYLRYSVGKQLLENAAKKAESEGRDLTKKEILSITNYINHKTGYGTGLSFTKGALSVPFLAPRYWLSKYQSVGDTFTKFATTPSLRPEIAKNTAVMLGTFAAVSALSEYLGGEAGIFQNPLKGSFGSIGDKNFGFDVTGGLSTEIRSLGRIATGGRIDAAGKEVSMPRDETLGRFLRSKLSPNAGTLYSLITGTDYNGNPENLTSLEGLTNVARGSVIGLFYQDVWKAFQKEYPGAALDQDAFGAMIQSIKDHPEKLGMFALGSAGSAFGVPPYIQKNTDYDIRDKRLQEMNPDKPGITWATADNIARNAYNTRYGKLPSTNEEAIKSEEIRAKQKQDNTLAQQNIDNEFKPGKDWRDAYGGAQIAIAAQIKANEDNRPFTGPERTDPNTKAVRAWGDYIDSVTPYPGGTDWNKVEKWLSENPDIAAEVDKYMSDPNKPSTALTPRVQEYRNDSKVIRDSGYWQLKDNLWAEINKHAPQPGYQPGQSYDDYKQAVITTIQDKLVASGMNASAAKKEATNLADKQQGISIFDQIYGDKVLIPWIAKNPEAFYDVAKWGYIQTPNKVEEKVLNAMEPTIRKREAEKKAELTPRELLNR